jgi:hypothetical protein
LALRAYKRWSIKNHLIQARREWRFARIRDEPETMAGTARPACANGSIAEKSNISVTPDFGFTGKSKTALLRIAPYASAIPQKNPVKSKKEYFFSPL